MKKYLILSIAVLGMAGSAHAAGDETSKRQAMARATEQYVREFTDALNGLKALSDERGKLIVDFKDSDFTGPTINNDIVHLSSATLAQLFDFVIPSLDANYQDSGNGGRNKQILLQIRGK